MHRRRYLLPGCLRIAGPSIEELASGQKNRQLSEQAEVDLYCSPRHYRFAVLITWPEPPLRHGVDSLLLQAQAGALYYAEAARMAGRVHFNRQNHHPRKLGFARFFRKFRLYFVDQLGWGDVVA